MVETRTDKCTNETTPPQMLKLVMTSPWGEISRLSEDRKS